MEKRDPMEMFQSAPKHKIITEEPKRQHEESNLQLAFCKWVKKNYPNLLFIRHEREQKRTGFMSNLFNVFNNADGIPDFELLEPVGAYNRLYIEFKKPSEKWLDKNGVVKKQYAHQYECHLKLWQRGSAVYFCNDLIMATIIFNKYIWDEALPKQEYEFPQRPDIDNLNWLK